MHWEPGEALVMVSVGADGSVNWSATPGGTMRSATPQRQKETTDAFIGGIGKAQSIGSSFNNFSRSAQGKGYRRRCSRAEIFNPERWRRLSPNLPIERAVLNRFADVV